MPNPPRAAGDGNNSDLDKTMAKTAGIVVFSGIAISILKALNPFNNNSDANAPRLEPLSESSRAEKTLVKSPLPSCCRSSSQQEPYFQTPVATSVEQNEVESTTKAIEIAKGDTLWGLSRKYGVSIEAIKEANGLTSDAIYAGKKLTIPQ